MSVQRGGTASLCARIGCWAPVVLLALTELAFAQEPTPPAPGSAAAMRLLELINKNDALTSEVAQLRGQIEELQRTLKQSQDLQKRVVTDLDSRLKGLESKPAPTVKQDDAALIALHGRLDQLESALQALQQALSATDAPGEADAADQAFDAALERFGAGEYQAAVDGFADFLARFPNDASVADARYWMGVAQLRQQNFRSAIDVERLMIEQHPNDKRVPDAHFVVGSALLALGDVPAARKTLEQLIAAHPSSEAAARAGTLLKQMP
jgi:tol-pal system protein YbgF